MGQERPQGKDLALEMERLYREYRAPMFRIALAILRDEGLAEDAVQQSFLKIFQNFEKIDRTDCNKTRSFIVILVKNTAIDLYRRRGRRMSSPLRTWNGLSRPRRHSRRSGPSPSWRGKSWPPALAKWRRSMQTFCCCGTTTATRTGRSPSCWG